MLSRRLLTSFVILLLFQIASVAQLPKRLERCLPNPTLAQEIRDMQREVEPQKVTLHVVHVEFDPKSAIPQELQREMAEKLRGETLEEDADTDYLKEAADEIAEVAVRGSLQNRGYFKVVAHTELTALKEEGSDIEVAATISAELGSRYWMGEIQFEPANSDRRLMQPRKVLRDLMPIKTGDLLNVDALREGLRKLTRFYNGQGYIDMTAEPEFNIEDSKHVHVVHVLVRIDEQRRYHMGQIEIWGLGALAKEQLLRALPQPGEIFDSARVQAAFERGNRILPADASFDEDVTIRRDAKEGNVSMILDFRPCPGETK